MKRTLYLVPCVKVKRQDEGFHAAEDLYTSVLFHYMKSYVKSRMVEGDEWRILSALYGLVHPQTPIITYECTLGNMPACDRRIWATMVKQQLDNENLFKDFRVVVLAGAVYRKDLLEWCTENGRNFEIPMYGMPIGRQLQWLKNQL